MLPKTEDELKAEWGLERFVKALGILSGWWLDKQHPIGTDQMVELMDQSKDAFLLFASRLYYQMSPNKRLKILQKARTSLRY